MRREIPLEMPDDIINDDVWLALSLDEDQIVKDADAIGFHEMPSTIRDYIKYRSRVEAGLWQLKRQYGMDIKRFRQLRSRTYLLKDLPFKDKIYLPVAVALFCYGKALGITGFELKSLNHQYERYSKN